MRDLKDLLEPLSAEEMPDRWTDVGRRSPRALPPTRRGSRAAAIVVAFAVVAAAAVLTWRALRPVDAVGPAGVTPNGAIAYLVPAIGGDGRIAATEIRLLDRRTGEDRSLITVEDPVSGLAWSPDGRLLRYWANGAFSLDPLTGQELQILGPRVSFPSWSTDGTQVVYKVDHDGRDAIEIADADGSDPRVLTEAANVASMDWSPDGTRIAFAGPGPEGARQGWDIYVIDVDGSNLLNLTNSDTVDLEPKWSPDGSTILFRSRRDPPQGWTRADGDAPDELYVMAPDGSNVRRLTRDSARDQWPTWSPDGSLILFGRQSGEEDGLFTIRPDGSDLTSLGVEGYAPAWQPVAASARGRSTGTAPSPTPPASTRRLQVYEALIRHLADPEGPQPIFVLSGLCGELTADRTCPGPLTRAEQAELTLRLKNLGELSFRTREKGDPLPEDASFQQILLGPIVERSDGIRVEGGSVCGGLCGSGAVYVLVPTDDGYRVTGTDDTYGSWIA